MCEIDNGQFTVDQAKNTAITGGQWNKIVLTYGQFYSMVHYNDAGFGGVYFYFTTNLTGGGLKISNFYGYSVEGLALAEQPIVNETIAKITALPNTKH